MDIVNKRYKICGKYIKEINYEKGFAKNYTKKDKLIHLEEDGVEKHYNVDEETGELHEVVLGRRNKATKDNHKRHKQINVARARSKTFDIVKSNVYKYKDKDGNVCKPVLLTLVCDEERVLTKAKILFKEYIKKLNYYIKKQHQDFEGLQYATTIEWQECGNIHFHSIVFNIPYIDVKILKDKWEKHGSLDIELIDEDGIENITKYITKTLKKENVAELDKCFSNSKLCIYSKGLYKPVIIDDIRGNEKDVYMVKQSITNAKQLYECKISNESRGEMVCKEFRINRGKRKKKAL